MEEEQLIKAIKKNPQLFGRVYDEYYSPIFNYCFKRTNDFNSSKDITSETFLKAYLSIHKFKWKGISIRSWLYRIATNEINLHYRSKHYRPRILSEISPENTGLIQADLLEEKEAAEKELERHEQFRKAREAISKLPLKYQEVLSLKYFERLKIREISEIIGKPEGTIKSLLSRGIGLLRNTL